MAAVTDPCMPHDAIDRTKNSYPINLSWKDIDYSITTYNKSTKSFDIKQILKGINGQARAGQMVAIMGPTGSGKTSLLNVLAMRCPIVKGGDLSGSFLVNGEVAKEKAFARLTSYVMQDDAMFAALTVKETLMTAAHFQLSSKLSDEDKEKYVDSIIAELGLNKCKDTIIRDAKTRGVSGGERKRCNIGVELIKNPSCLFLDEPTSGLDSFQAQSVMGALKTLASNGRTVVASIHQPRSSIYAMFDQLLLLSEGKLIYTGNAHDAVEYFTSKGQECPALFNPADFFLDVVSPDYRSADLEKESLGRIKMLSDSWEATAITDVEDVELATKNAEQNEALQNANLGFQSSWFRQFQLCFVRSFITTKRNKVATYGKVIASIFFGLLLGALYSETSYNQKSIQDRVGILFFFTINQTFSNMFAVLNSFTGDKIVVERERASNSYHISAFYSAKFCAEIPFNFVGPIVFGTIVFWIVGLGEGDFWNFCVFLVLLTLVGFCAIALGMAIAATAPDVEAATAFGPIVVVLMILFGGFYINIESLPVWLRWVQYLSLMRFAFEGLCVNEFKDLVFSCDDVDVGGACVETGQDVLNRLSFTMTVGEIMIWLVVFMGVVHVIAYHILEKKKRSYQGFNGGKKLKQVSGKIN
ncbi:hypothetical protein TrVE_jg3568 [Triparma verrucosa]|uniref:ABC transporter domain-containing protein n=1 Tax=Triparma verrucosa TaxID=1606542 RepID=A0A9W7F568_9STRA|nr:hypothetical protein TrVE_jg3568 [Triparma verrucosa]